MSLLPFGNLPAYAPRKFIPRNIDLGNWSAIEPQFDRLESLAAACKTPADLETWLMSWSELSAALDEESSRRYIAMTCHTDDAEAKKAYLDFVEHIEPHLKPRKFRLAKLFLAHPLLEKLTTERYEMLERDTRVQVELFRNENVPLETDETKIEQQYQELTGSLTVRFRGEEKTLPQMSPFLEEPDRAIRQEAWELVATRRLQEAERFDDIFDRLLKLREQISINAGFANYRDYSFRRLRRFDYTPEDCRRFHAAVESEFMPVVRELQERRRAQLNVTTLRPWDMEVDPLNRPPLRPFKEVGEMVDRTQRIFDRLDPGLAAGFRQMGEMRLLDLDNRKGKAPGGYQATLAEARLPFIFMNAVGVHRDVDTLLHEAGHAFHALASRQENLYAYRDAPIEFCEVASMSMELLASPHLGEFYSQTDADRARRMHLEGIVKFFPWMATVDAFQHWIYTYPGHARAERTAAWLEILDRFGGTVDWSGFEKARASLWHRQLHIFIHPFYYVEYGIAQLGALQVWANSKKNKAEALQAYQRGLALGGSRSLPRLFEAAGCRFDFSAETIRPLIRLVRDELDRLS